MKGIVWHGRRVPAWSGLLALALLPALAARAQAGLSAEAIMQRAVQRAESSASREGRPEYRYEKHTVTEQMDSKGRLKDRQEKLYEVKVEAGLSQLKLVKVNGKELSPEELKKQDEQEREARQKMTDSQPGKKGDERENFLTAEMVSKYQFTLVDKVTLNGRMAYHLSFAPKPGLTVNKLTDRFLNQMAGTVWIDAEDFEIARAEIHLLGEVTLWGGIVGTLRECDYTMERTRMPDGAWFNSFSHGYFEGRKLLEPMLIRTRSQSTDFRRVDLALK